MILNTDFVMGFRDLGPAIALTFVVQVRGASTPFHALPRPCIPFHAIPCASVALPSPSPPPSSSLSSLSIALPRVVQAAQLEKRNLDRLLGEYPRARAAVQRRAYKLAFRKAMVLVAANARR